MVQAMLKAACNAKELAYSPYSRFQVGCCVKSSTDKLYSGCNIENASYGLTLCAESSAIAAMVNAGEKSIKEILITSSGDKLCPPCGACRQRIREFASADIAIYLYAKNGEQKIFTLSELLPFSFGPDNLSPL